MRRLPIALAAVIGSFALPSTASAAPPLDTFVRCVSAPGASMTVCAENLSHDVEYQLYVCYNAAIRVLNEGDARELAGCAAEAKRSAFARKSSRRSSRARSR